MTVEVSFMSGAGNLFSVIDNRAHRFSVERGRALAPLLCVGLSAPAGGEVLRATEGLMLIGEASEDEAREGFDFQMLFFNPDGSYGAMCGNGGRCAVAFAFERGFFDKSEGVRFSALGAAYSAEFTDDSRSSVRLFFPPPRKVIYPFAITPAGATLQIGYADVGSDHAVVNFDDLASTAGGDFDSFDITLWGGRVRHYEAYPQAAPRGANANFYLLESGTGGEPTVRLRTFERGVEAETGACGTGAISTALVGCLRHGLQSPVNILPASGSPLAVRFRQTETGFEDVSLEGGAQTLAAQTFEIERFPE